MLLLASRLQGERKLVERLWTAYRLWSEKLDVKELINFLNISSLAGRKLGKYSQWIGRMRSIALEEFLYLLLVERYGGEHRVVWNQPMPISDPLPYRVTPDIVIQSDEKLVVVEAKVEVDAQRLKALLWDIMILKMNYPKLWAILVYHTLDGKVLLLDYAKATFIDHVFEIDDGVVERILSCIDKFMGIP